MSVPENDGQAVDPTAQETGTDLVTSLSAPPVYDNINERRLALIKNTVAKNANDAEVGQFLELCARYDLDPFAKEAWCAKGKGDNPQLLIMVGRDGLRKIAQRRGLRLDCDVVREGDTFDVARGKDRSRTINHTYAGSADQRGKVVGAWAEVFEPRSGQQLGFFFAPLSEYRPTSESKLKYSPWGSQESVMILAAAERQALRQATPLGGLMGEGEMDLNEEREASPAPAAEPPSEPIGEERARELYDVALASGITPQRLRTAAATYAGQDPGELAERDSAVASLGALLNEHGGNQLGAWIDSKVPQATAEEVPSA